jgi:peptidoglycan biosynthesis protein MviN/MurJ (putative lipid II flippase)
LVILLRRRLQGIEGEPLVTVLTRVLVAAAMMGVATWALDYAMTELLPGRQILFRAARLSAAIGGGVAVLAAAAKMLNIAGFEDALELLGVHFVRNEGK